MNPLRSTLLLLRLIYLATFVLLQGVLIYPAFALPAYARQTGQACIACHASFPELTPYGRQFKLLGYTTGTMQTVPLAVMAVASASHVGSTQGNSDAFGRNNELVFEGGSLFLGSKLGDHAGVFSQWTYNNLNAFTAADGSTQYGGVTTADNNDWRLVNRITEDDIDLVLGADFNNNPTVQDVWNGTPAFAFPFQTSRMAGNWGIGAPATLIEGGLAQQAVGLSGYVWLNHEWYLEAGSYKSADGAFSAFSHNVDFSNRLKGGNLYYRGAWNHEWGNQSLEFGLFGLDAQVYSDPTDTQSPSDKFRDIGLDAQYQYISDPHSITAQFSTIHEHTDWDASHLGVDHSNTTSTLNSTHLKVSYWYQRQYGATLAGFWEDGTTDWLAYSQNGSPDTHGLIAEADYNIRPNIRLGLQYTAFLRYLGASSNYDGNGHNASDNNITYLYLWLAF